MDYSNITLLISILSLGVSLAMVIVNALFSFSNKSVEQTRCYLNFINNREYAWIIEQIIKFKHDKERSKYIVKKYRSILNELFSNLEALEHILRFSFLERYLKAYYHEMSMNYMICVLVIDADNEERTLNIVKKNLIKEREKLWEEGYEDYEEK